MDETGDLRRMDEPFFHAEPIAPGTWLIRSDGDFSHSVEGKRESLLIDFGYGRGDIRAFCRTLTDRPVRHTANTHPHFDRTANNGRFDPVYLTRRCREPVTRPFPSFEGIPVPRDYPVCRHGRSCRDESRAYTIVTTNLLFSRWTELFENATMVSALVDRLTFRSHILDMSGESYRLLSTQADAGK